MIFKITMRTALFAILFLATVFTACKKGDLIKNDPDPDPTEEPVIPEPTVPGVVYAVGTKENANKVPNAVMWKDGVLTTISSRYSSAAGIAVKDTDIYVAGNDGSSRACYWKNGKVTLLNNGAFQTNGTDIAVSGSDVYVCGYSSRSDTGNDAICWKNGIATLLPTPNNVAAFAYDITVIGADVYVCGAYNTTRLIKACYWKNNVFHALTGGETSFPSAAYGITSNGSDIYIGGYVTERSATGTFLSATSWKNGVPAALTRPNGNNNSTVATVAYANGRLYAAGAAIYGTAYQPVYWVGAKVNMLNRSGWSDDIAVYGPSVYVGGMLATNNSQNTQAIFWKDQTELFTSPAISNVTGITVVPKK